MSGEEIVHLFLYFPLTLRVDGQQVAGEGQRIAAGLVACQQKDKSLTHDLILRYHLFLWTSGGGLLWVRTVVLIGGGRLGLLVPVLEVTGRFGCQSV